MFGMLVNNEIIRDTSSEYNKRAYLMPNSKFVPVRCGINEEHLFLLIKDSYKNKNKLLLEKYIGIYKEKLYTENTETINEYNENMNNNKW
jgi:hypothetical protein